MVVGRLFAPSKPCGSAVTPGTLSSAELAATQDQVEKAATGQFISVGQGASTVVLTLMAGDEALAAHIAHTFGSKVTISVGLTNYCGGPGRSPACDPMPKGNALPTGLSLKLVLDRRTIKTGALGSAVLVAHESGPSTFQMDTGQPIVAQLVRLGTRKVVGTFDAGIGGTGISGEVGPDQSERIQVLFGTARCDGGIGSAMPPGRYDILVYIHSEKPGPGPLYYAPGVPIVVTRG